LTTRFGNALFLRASSVCTYDHGPRLARQTDHSAVVLRMSFATGQPDWRALSELLGAGLSRPGDCS
jgi:hypothetical protein